MSQSNPVPSQNVFMEEALKLAKRAKGLTAPNPPVGALVVNSNGEIIGRGFHPKAGEPHAEVFAIKDALERTSSLKDCTLYVTLEPCNHFGKTPPCCDLIISHGVGRVVIGTRDPNPLMQGKSIETLSANGVVVDELENSNAPQKLIRGFASVITNGRPFITLKSATSLDGKIATSSGDSKWITGPEARLYAHTERAEHDGILIGVGTLLSDDPQLTVRDGSDHLGLTKIILDSNLRTPVTAKLLSTAGTTLIYCNSRPVDQLVHALQNAGAIVVPVPEKQLNENLDLHWILKDLAQRGVQDILVEGGAKVLGAFVRERLFDRILSFIAPRILGSTSKDVFEGVGVFSLSQSIDFETVSTRLIGNDIVIEGRATCLLA